jgi:hypothetical protein
MNPENISNEIQVALKMIIDKCPDIVVGGSIALNAVGLIDRKVSDIDLFCLNTSSLNKNGFLNIESDIQLSDTVTDMNGVEIQRTGCKINGVKVCVFKVDKFQLEHSTINVLGMDLKIQNVNYAIMAKKIYANRPGVWNEKHKLDILNIEDTLNLF